ncbi:MAG: cytochrome c3 family protein [Coriobacteriales bacterium]|jgi:hypothetical protein|nr:cytochrome c3 family protein [Coriobacteriales bacterium]
MDEEKVGTSPEEIPDSAVNAQKEKKPKKKGKKRVVLWVVVIVLVVIFGGGGTVYATQHSNPLFCNAVCHSPMEPYVQSYLEGTSVVAEQANLKYPLTVTIHKDSDQEVVCLDCHPDGLDVQISEGISWITGDYSVPLEPLTLTVKDPKKATERSGVKTCLVAGCHEGISSLDELKEFTANRSRNPHSNHNGDLACTTCHKAHEQSVLFCTQCHEYETDGKTKIVVPDGWLTYTEKQLQLKEASQSK